METETLVVIHLIPSSVLVFAVSGLCSAKGSVITAEGSSTPAEGPSSTFASEISCCREDDEDVSLKDSQLPSSRFIAFTKCMIAIIVESSESDEDSDKPEIGADPYMETQTDDSEQERNGNQGMEVELKFLLMESLGFVAGSVEMTMTSGIVRQH
nr:hypothetical protein Iba_chr15bCG1500 [Ipomoea batatas]